MNWANQISSAMQWVYGVIRISLIWIVFSFPYILLYLSLLLAEDSKSVGGTLGLAILLAPFIFIPSLVAMLGLCKSLLENSSEFDKTVSRYWRYYRRDYLKSVVIGIVYVLLLIMFYIAYYYYSQLFNPLSNIFLVLFYLTLIAFIYSLCFLSDRKLSIKQYIQNGYLLVFFHPINTLMMIFGIFLSYFILSNILPMTLCLLFFPCTIGLITMAFYNKGIKQEIEKVSE